MNEHQEAIYKSIKLQIATAQLKVGDFIPTEKELCDLYQTKRMNAHFAVKALLEEGWVFRNKRRGTEVVKAMSPDESQRYLNSQSKRIAICSSVFTKFSVHWASDTSSQLEAKFKAAGYEAVFYEMSFEGDDCEQMMSRLIEGGAYAVIVLLSSEDFRGFLEHKSVFDRYKGELYFLNSGEFLHQELPFHALSFDHHEEGMMAHQHLIEVGSEEVVLVTGSATHEPYPLWLEYRIGGWRQVHPDGEILSLAQSDRVIERLKASKQLGVIAQNDLTAVELLKRCKEHGLEAPRDFKLVSFDDLPMVRAYDLTTIAPPVEKVSDLFVEMVLSNPWKIAHGVKCSLKVSSRMVKRKTS